MEKAEATWTSICKEFDDPSASCRPHTWWHWMNGHISRAGITQDLEAMKSAGFGGFTLFNCAEGIPAGPVKYMSPEWWSLLDHTFVEVRRLDLRMAIFNCAGWAQTGGPWVTPDRAMQEVVWTERQVRGPMPFDEELETPRPALGIERDMSRDPKINQRYYVPRENVAGFYRDIGVFAFPALPGDLGDDPWRLENWWEKASFAKPMRGVTQDLRSTPPSAIVEPEMVIDLTNRLDANGHLNWAVPPGDWTILRIGYQPTGRQNHPAPIEGRGLEINKLSADAVDFFWEQSLAKVIKQANGALYGIFIDSYEAGHQNWTDGFPDAFREVCGYDIHPHLIALTGRVLRDVEHTERFLSDFRKTIGELTLRNYYGRFSERCRENGLQFINEPYGRYGNTDDHAVAAISDLPMCEFWAFRLNDDKWHYATGKLVSSAAHTHGRPIAGSEAFTGVPQFAYEEHPYSLKAQGDHFFCEGINHQSLHTFAHDPYGVAPGLGLGSYGSHFDRRNTWWPFIGPWLSYLTRGNFLLQQGVFVADFLYYTGENVPRHAKISDQLKPKPPAGFDFDFCDTSALHKLEVCHGRLVLPSGMTYRVLVIPEDAELSHTSGQLINGLLKQGAVVIGMNTIRIPGLTPKLSSTDQLVSAPSWQAEGGRIYDLNSMEQLLVDLKLQPDFQCEPAAGIEWIHRRVGEGDIYFLSNQNDDDVSLSATFRTAYEQVELWRADTGEKMRTVGKATGDGRMAVNLKLDPSGSLFVVFPPIASPDLAPLPPEAHDEFRLDVPWEVLFPPGKGAPLQIQLNQLLDLSRHEHPGVKYFSGIATYEATFTLPESIASSEFKLELDLGDVQVAASIILNGQEVGKLWKAPYRVDVTDALDAGGENHLEINVANLWINRLVGDEQLPDDCQWTTETGSTAIGQGLVAIPDWLKNGQMRPNPDRIAFAAWKWPQFAHKSPTPSGLIGPIRLRVSQW